jgi:hypothetical protein
VVQKPAQIVASESIREPYISYGWAGKVIGKSVLNFATHSARGEVLGRGRMEAGALRGVCDGTSGQANDPGSMAK